MSGINLNGKVGMTQFLKDGTSKRDIYITPEIRASLAQYTDPLTQCFKLMIDYDKPYGLFAPETQVNSALAYLKRIGETDRYNMLVRWIENFKILVKEYDFLLLNCEGIDVIVNKKPYHVFNEEDKLILVFRETSDMFIQSLITQYRHIWFDTVRCVEVIPANLRRFDFAILIYNAGYYNMALYDVMENNDLTDKDIETKVFPTIRKISDKYFNENTENFGFNHHLITVGDASIDYSETGKNFFENVSNEGGSDYTKTNFTFNFRFGNYKGTFNNIFGEFDFVKVLALASAQDRVSNETKKDGLSKKDKFKKAFKTQLTGSKETVKKLAKQQLTTLADKPQQYLKALTGNTFIGEALRTISDPVGTLAKLTQNTIDKTIQNLENKYIYDNMAKLNNMVSKNFSDDFYEVYDNYIKKDNIPNNVEYKQTIDDYNVVKTDSNEKIGQAVKYEVTNIYQRKGF